MFFPFMSSYDFLINRNQRRTPWDEVPGTLEMRDYSKPGSMDDMQTRHGMPWSREIDDADTGQASTSDRFNPKKARQREMGAGLTALGSQLLSSATTGDYTGGLGRGAAAFTEAVGTERDRNRRDRIETNEEGRRQRQDTRAEAQEKDRSRAAESDYQHGEAEFGVWQEQQTRGKKLREATGKSADQMVADINAMAAQNPNDQKLQAMAKRAVGYALGEDSDLNKLAGLHAEVTGQAYRDQDFDWETGAGIKRRVAEIGAGVTPDPKAAERRAEEELGIQRGHLAVAQENANTQRDTRTKDLSLLQSFDRLQDIADQKFKDKQAAWENTKAGTEYADKYGAPPPNLVNKWKQEALKEAQDDFRNTLNSSYQYTADGRVIPPGR